MCEFRMAEFRMAEFRIVEFRMAEFKMVEFRMAKFKMTFYDNATMSMIPIKLLVLPFIYNFESNKTVSKPITIEWIERDY